MLFISFQIKIILRQVPPERYKPVLQERQVEGSEHVAQIEGHVSQVEKEG